MPSARRRSFDLICRSALRRASNRARAASIVARNSPSAVERSISPSTVTTRRPRSISVFRSFVLRRSRSMSTATTIENLPARASSSISAHRVPARRFFVADTALSS